MSQPKRYKLRLEEISYGTEESPAGAYVLYADYAALQAENERMQSNIFGRDDTIAGLDSIIKCRDEEIERLRNAGDAMAAIIRPPAHGPGEWDGEYDAWLAAKGVQS